jgi:very-short-patch-repair endonuclease
MPAKKSTPHLQHRAGELRKEPTEAEARLWSRLRLLDMKGTHFRRQHAIGPYIVDFCAVKLKLIIEVDGGQHLEKEEYDRDRTEYLEMKGYRVLRFWNNEVMGDIDTVVGVILDEVGNRTPP